MLAHWLGRCACVSFCVPACLRARAGMTKSVRAVRACTDVAMLAQGLAQPAWRPALLYVCVYTRAHRHFVRHGWAAGATTAAMCAINSRRRRRWIRAESSVPCRNGSTLRCVHVCASVCGVGPSSRHCCSVQQMRAAAATWCQCLHPSARSACNHLHGCPRARTHVRERAHTHTYTRRCLTCGACLG